MDDEDARVLETYLHNRVLMRHDKISRFMVSKDVWRKLKAPARAPQIRDYAECCFADLEELTGTIDDPKMAINAPVWRDLELQLLALGAGVLDGRTEYPRNPLFHPIDEGKTIRPHVLSVDGTSFVDRFEVERALGKRNIRVRSTAGLTMLDELAANGPAVILVDPESALMGGSGAGLLAWLRRLERSTAARIVLHTALRLTPQMAGIEAHRFLEKRVEVGSARFALQLEDELLAAEWDPVRVRIMDPRTLLSLPPEQAAEIARRGLVTAMPKSTEVAIPA